MIDTLVLLRKQLHENPELSGKEHETANRIVEFVKDFNPTQIIKGVGGTGVGGCLSICRKWTYSCD